MKRAGLGIAIAWTLACVGGSSSKPPVESDADTAGDPSDASDTSETDDGDGQDRRESGETGETGESGSGEGALVVERETLGFGADGLSLDLFRARAAGRRPTVVLAHGGLWQAGDRHALAPTCTAIVERSDGALACASIDYRLSGALGGSCDGSGGDSYREQLADFAAAFVLLRDQADALGLDPARITVGGHSAGAHLAWLLALRWPSLEPCARARACPGPAGAIGFEGIYDVASWDAYDATHWSGQFACATRRAFGASPGSPAPCMDPSSSLTCWDAGSPTYLVEHAAAHANDLGVTPIAAGLLVHSPADDWVDLAEATRLGEAVAAAFPETRLQVTTDGSCASGSHNAAPGEAALADCIVAFVLEP